MGPDTIWIFIPVTALLIPISAIMSSHFQKMAEIKSRANTNLSADVRMELDAMKAELQNLRDTTTKFDMAFDGALDRLEQRMDAAQLPVAANTEYPTPRRDLSAPANPQYVSAGRKGDF